LELVNGHKLTKILNFQKKNYNFSTNDTWSKSKNRQNFAALTLHVFGCTDQCPISLRAIAKRQAAYFAVARKAIGHWLVQCVRSHCASRKYAQSARLPAARRYKQFLSKIKTF
jgi:hypothetical protein